MDISSKTRSKAISDYRNDDVEEMDVISVMNAESEVDREDEATMILKIQLSRSYYVVLFVLKCRVFQ